MIETLIGTFLIHLEDENRSGKTLIWHRASLGKFARWMEANGESAVPDHWSAATIRHYYIALKHETKPNG